jgi:hypothetical protein
MDARAIGAGIVVSAALAALVLGGCSSSPSNQSAGTTTSTSAATTSSTGSATTSTTSASSTSAPSSGAPCTHRAIAAAARSDTNLGQVDAVENFGCSGSWGFANVTVGSGSGAYDAVIVLQAEGSSWSVADRATACSNHLVPSDIYTQACTTS